MPGYGILSLEGCGVFDEAAATREPGGGGGLEEHVSPASLILQRLNDLKAEIADLRIREIGELRTDLRRLDDRVEGMRNWFLGTLVTALVAAGSSLATLLARHP